MQFEYTDDTVMHTGIHKDKLLKEIPASYFVYVYDKGFVNNLMKAYIEKNISRFRMEAIAEKQKAKAQRSYERK